MNMLRTLRWACVMALSLCVSGCSAPPRGADLGLIYNEAAQKVGDARNPVVVIPGILGSRLEAGDGTQVWGAWIYGAADTDTARGARLVGLPMRRGVPLAELRDDVVATEVLDTLSLDVGLIRGVQLGVYVDILKTLDAGRYRDRTLGESGAYRGGPVDYAGLHYTCFQFAYDWRRDISEQASELHDLITAAIEAQPAGGGKVDVVAHSMGGLVLRYYLRYGPTPLPEDGSLPELDWEGARYVENAILIGTPSSGSVLSLEQLVMGVNFASFITPTYDAALLGTMPSIYQLLPRPRHARVIDGATGDPIDLYDPRVWESLEWGLGDPGEEGTLRQLLPDVADASERRAIAMDHLAKALSKAEQLHRSLDVPAMPPAGTTLHLIAGDAKATPDVVSVDSATGRIRISANAPGDNTVTRASALMDERQGAAYVPRVRSPVSFGSVVFLISDHLGLTRDPLFANYVLYTLLERPRDDATLGAEEEGVGP